MSHIHFLTSVFFVHITTCLHIQLILLVGHGLNTFTSMYFFFGRPFSKWVVLLNFGVILMCIAPICYLKEEWLFTFTLLFWTGNAHFMLKGIGSSQTLASLLTGLVSSLMYKGIKRYAIMSFWNIFAWYKILIRMSFSKAGKSDYAKYPSHWNILIKLVGTLLHERLDHFMSTRRCRFH